MSTSSSTTQSSQSSTTSLTPASSAPLPSPTASPSHHSQYFGSLDAHHQQQPQQQSQTQQQQHTSYNYRPNREGAGLTAAETNTFLNHSALLAEAAKRAQLAVVMRDIEGMEL